jgi:LacI family transcriptional regulator
MPVSLRQLAEACGVSTATVSRALSGHPYVKKALRERIQREATRAGYASNRLVGSLMAHVRRTRTHRFVGNVAIVHVPGPQALRIGPQEKRIIESARLRAAELGFSAETFELQPDARGEAALVRVLRARGIAGVIFFYPQPHLAPCEFPWSEFSALALDFASREPRLNTVCHDHYASLTMAVGRLREAGYKRVGLFLEHYKDARTNFKWSASFRSVQLQEGGIGDVPVLMETSMGEAAFTRWFRRHRPDLVLGHFDDSIRWMERQKLAVPADVGFFNLNWLGRSMPCAGIDPQLDLQGRVAADTLISQIQHGERGLPDTPRLISVPGRFVPGPTIHAPAHKFA